MLQIYVEAERRANLFAVPGRHSICGDAGHTMIFYNFEAEYTIERRPWTHSRDFTR